MKSFALFFLLFKSYLPVLIFHY